MWQRKTMKTSTTYKRKLIRHLIDDVIDSSTSWDVLMADDEDWSNMAKSRIRLAIDCLKANLEDLL